MKLELILEALKTLKDEWYPPTTEGAPRKVKVTAGGLALLGLFIVVPAGWYKLQSIQSAQAAQGAILADVKGDVKSIWTALVAQGRIAKAEPPKETPTKAPFRIESFNIIGAAEASTTDGGGVPRPVPARDPVPVGGESVGQVAKEKD